MAKEQKRLTHEETEEFVSGWKAKAAKERIARCNPDVIAKAAAEARAAVRGER